MKKFITTLIVFSFTFFCLKGIIFGGGAWYKPGTNRNITLLHDLHYEVNMIEDHPQALKAAYNNTDNQIADIANYARKNSAHIYTEDSRIQTTFRIKPSPLTRKPRRSFRAQGAKSPLFIQDVRNKYNINVTNIDNRDPSDQQHLIRPLSNVKATQATHESLREHIGINSILSDGCVPDHEVTDSLDLERVKQRLCAWLALDKKRYNLFKTFYNQNSQDRPLKKAGELNPTCSVEEKMALELLKNEQNGTKNKAIMIAGAGHTHNFRKFLMQAGYKPNPSHYQVIPTDKYINFYSDTIYKNFEKRCFDIKYFLQKKPYTLNRALREQLFADEEVKVSKQQKPPQKPPWYQRLLNTFWSKQA